MRSKYIARIERSSLMQLRFQAGADAWVKGLCAGLSAKVKILGLKFIGKQQEVAHFVDITIEDGRMGELRSG